MRIFSSRDAYLFIKRCVSFSWYKTKYNKKVHELIKDHGLKKYFFQEFISDSCELFLH